MATESILIDTGAVVALLDTGEEHHQAIRSYLGKRILLPVTLLAEIDYMVSKYLGDHVARAFLLVWKTVILSYWVLTRLILLERTRSWHATLMFRLVLLMPA